LGAPDGAVARANLFGECWGIGSEHVRRLAREGEAVRYCSQRRQAAESSAPDLAVVRAEERL